MVLNDSAMPYFGPALIMGLLWKHTTGWGIVAGVVVALVTAVVWRITLHDQFYELGPAFVLSLITIVIASLLTGRGLRG